MSRLMSLVDQLHRENLRPLDKLTFGVLTAPQPCSLPLRPGCSAKVPGRGFISSHHCGGRVHEVMMLFLTDPPINHEYCRIWAKSQWAARQLQSFYYFRLLSIFSECGKQCNILPFTFRPRFECCLCCVTSGKLLNPSDPRISHSVISYI